MVEPGASEGFTMYLDPATESAEIKSGMGKTGETIKSMFAGVTPKEERNFFSRKEGSLPTVDSVVADLTNARWAKGGEYDNGSASIYQIDVDEGKPAWTGRISPDGQHLRLQTYRGFGSKETSQEVGRPDTIDFDASDGTLELNNFDGRVIYTKPTSTEAPTA